MDSSASGPAGVGSGPVWVGKWSNSKQKYYFYDRTLKEPKTTYKEPVRVDEWHGGPRSVDSSVRITGGVAAGVKAKEQQQVPASPLSPAGAKEQQQVPASPLSPAGGGVWVGKWTAKKGKYYFYDKTQQEPKPTYQQPARVDEWIGGPRAKESSFKDVESTLPVGADHVEEASERRESAKRRERVKSMRQQHAAPASPLSPASAAVWVGKYSEKKRTYYYYDETQPGVKPTFTQPAQVGKWIGGPRAAQGAAPAPAAAAVAVTPSATPSPSAAGAAPLAEAAASAPEEAGPPLRSALSDYVCPLAAPLTESRPGPPGWYWVHFDRDEPKWGSATCNADGCGEVLRYSSGQGPLRYHALGHDFRPPSSSAPRSPPRARPQARAPSQERRASRDCSDR